MSSASSAGAKRRVLVVEDEYLIAQDTARTLRALGYEVVGPVPDVSEAMSCIGNEKLDAVLLDINLEGSSSAIVAIALAKLDVPFIVVTGYGTLELAEPILQNAPRVIKPVATSDLAAILIHTMSR